MKKTELIDFLNEIGASPRKHLSQNFLIDGNILRKLIHLADIQPGDHVLEIGPGPGAITEQLLAAGAHVVAVEKDKLFAEHLKNHPQLKVYCDDVLKFPFEKLRGKKWKVVSNLPFHITAPILEKLVEHSDLFDSFTLIVQKEVGERIQAKPKTKIYSSLTIFLQFYTTFQSLFSIPGSCFYPKPSVDSIAVRLNVRTPPNVDQALFFKLLRKAFCQRRKMLTSSLRDEVENLGELLESIQISKTARPEELSLEEWVSLISKIASTFA